MKNLLLSLLLLTFSFTSYGQFHDLKLIPTTETCGCYNTVGTKIPKSNNKISVVDITLYHNAIVIGNTTWVHRSDSVWINQDGDFAVLEPYNGKYQFLTKKYVYVFSRTKSNG